MSTLFDLLTDEKGFLQKKNTIDFDCVSNNILYHLQKGDIRYNFWAKMVHKYLLSHHEEESELTPTELENAQGMVREIIFVIDDNDNDRENFFANIEQEI